MVSPTIIIGLGTSGLKILENIQRFQYDTFGTNCPRNVKYIFIDTDKNVTPQETPIGNDIRKVYIGLSDIPKMVSHVKLDCDNPEWLPELDIAIGTGYFGRGIRNFGRLALWGKHKDGDNFNNVIDALEHSFASLMRLDDRLTSPVVFITGSLTGGTGSGIFIDIAYIVRHIIKGIDYLFGLFLLPPEITDIRGKEDIFGNAFGALKDLEYYNNRDNHYKEKWPNGYTVDYVEPPFAFTQFISQDYLDGRPALANLASLYKMAGLYLFLNIAGIFNRRMAQLICEFGRNPFANYGTFGLSAIQYPKDQITENVSLQLSIELLERYLDKRKCIINGQYDIIRRPQIKEVICKSIDKIMEKAFTSLNIDGGINLLELIDLDTLKINKGNINDSPVQTIINLFNSSGTNNYYAKVKSNILSAKGIFIDEIYNIVNTSAQTTENFNYSRIVLEECVNFIESNLTYWGSLNLSEVHQNWDDQLRHLARSCTKKTYKLLIEHDTILKERLNTIFTLMKMHLSFDFLNEICNNIRTHRIDLQSTVKRNILPHLELFDNLIKKTSDLIHGSINQNISFFQRIDEINGEINDNSFPILNIYPSQSFSQECELAKEKYYQINGEIRTLEEILGDVSVFEYFRRNIENFDRTLFFDFIRNYRLCIEGANVINDINVADYIYQNPNQSIEYAKIATFPLLSTNSVFSKPHYIPKFIISNNLNDINRVVQIFKNEDFSAFDNDPRNTVELQGLSNIMVFYDERVSIDPLNSNECLTYINQMKKAFENVPPDMADKNITPEIWRKNRSAYSTF